jgi:hypothetical protein
MLVKLYSLPVTKTIVSKNIQKLSVACKNKCLSDSCLADDAECTLAWVSAEQ